MQSADGFIIFKEQMNNITSYLESDTIIKFDGGLSWTSKSATGEAGKSSVLPPSYFPETAKPLNVTSGSSLMATGWLRSTACTSLCSITVTESVGGMYSFWSSK